MKKFYLEEKGIENFSGEEKKLFSEAIKIVLEELSSNLQKPNSENELDTKVVHFNFFLLF